MKTEIHEGTCLIKTSPKQTTDFKTCIPATLLNELEVTSSLKNISEYLDVTTHRGSAFRGVLPEEVQRTAVDQLALLQTAPGVLLLPAAQHKLLIGLITLSPIVMGSGFKDG